MKTEIGEDLSKNAGSASSTSSACGRVPQENVPIGGGAIAERTASAGGSRTAARHVMALVATVATALLGAPKASASPTWTWEYLGSPTTAGLSEMAVDPRDDGLLYVGNHEGLYVLRNGVWTLALQGYTGWSNGIVIDPDNPDVVWVTSKSDDGCSA